MLIHSMKSAVDVVNKVEPSEPKITKDKGGGREKKGVGQSKRRKRT